MCLILFGWKVHPDYPLILAANRDEFFSRPTKTVHWWEDHPNLLGGRDLKAGGTWMGITKEGRFAAITNYRQFPITKTYATSRGDLVANFLSSNIGSEEYMEELNASRDSYDGYNLIFGNQDAIYYFGNQSNNNGPIDPGVHGLSNHLLDTPWPKVTRGKEALKRQIQEGKVVPEHYLSLLNNKEQAPDDQLPDTGIGLEKERWLSAMFINEHNYGTRSSYVALFHRSGNIELVEKSYVPEQEQQFRFNVVSS